MKKSKKRSNPLDLNHVFCSWKWSARAVLQRARRLGTPANSVSRKIQELEAQVGSR